jgi:hypothetical protein
LRRSDVWKLSCPSRDSRVHAQVCPSVNAIAKIIEPNWPNQNNFS